jgi:enterochelin esterase-like enzyme
MNDVVRQSHGLGMLAASLAALAMLASAAAAQERPPAPDAGLPGGELVEFSFSSSRIFPGTTRQVVVYVPDRHDGKTPACVHVNQDGVQFDWPQVLDRLIAEKKIPVMVGVFVKPGRVPANRPGLHDRFNRSCEYDGLGDAYARFLVEELLPAVEQRKTSDGRSIVLSTQGNDRSIGGTSTGAIAAFTAAWERPDAFSRVFSGIGTYVGMRGGHVYPTLIRKTEPKAIRVFLEDGSNDLNIYAGDWWIANQAMQRSLAFAGYEVRYAWGDGGHNGRHATEVFPEALEWLWSGWPEPVGRGEGSQQLKGILVQGEGWRPVGNNDADGASGGADPPPARQWPGGDAVRASSGWTYATEPAASGGAGVVLHCIGPDGVDHAVVTELRQSGGICLSSDQANLFVADAASRWVWAWTIEPAGRLANGQRFHALHVPEDADDAAAAGLCVDRDGRLWVATRMGLQICDQIGRVQAIVPMPAGAATAVRFTGEKLDEVLVHCGDKAFIRKVKAVGAPAHLPPVVPPKPSL